MSASNQEISMEQVQGESLHTGVTKDPASTPGYFRMLLAALPARYALRSGIQLFTDWPPIVWLDKHVLSLPAKMKPFDDFVKGREAALPIDKITRQARLYDPTLTTATLENWRGNTVAQEGGLATLQKSMRDRILASHYDNGLGIGSIIVTALYALRVKSDVWHSFAETVAYENGKDPKNITSLDIMRSDNKLVQSTVQNFINKTLGRLATDAIFFGRHLAHIPGVHVGFKTMNFGELGIGAKGYFLLRDILAKQTTLFEDLTQLIDRKLNPIKGIGERISTSDVIDLYQKYALIHEKDAAFKDATIRERRDGIDWPKTERVFNRIADLMNQTYKYKHSSLDHVSYEHRELQASSDFALPKFLYLLGHGLIDPRRPEQSLAYVELANKNGIEAVKTVRSQTERGISLRDALHPYGMGVDGLDLTPNQTETEKPLSAANDTSLEKTLSNSVVAKEVAKLPANENEPLPDLPGKKVLDGQHVARLQAMPQHDLPAA